MALVQVYVNWQSMINPELVRIRRLLSNQKQKNKQKQKTIRWLLLSFRETLFFFFAMCVECYGKCGEKFRSN